MPALKSMAYAYRVSDEGKLKLGSIDPDYHDGLSEEDAVIKTGKYGERMAELLELLYAAHQNSLLVVLQGRDTSGKDGTIRRVLHYCNVQSTRVCPFKVPTAIEASHDFLWRVHAVSPGKGDVTIFNRSHYEDVLAARVHNLVDKKTIKCRYGHINDFEQLLVDNGTIVVKFFLHISKDEQEKRLLAREENPDKSWKLALGDWKERELWGELADAYEIALSKCSPPHAPWRIVPANHKWFRDLAVVQAIVDELEPYKKSWKKELENLGIVEKAQLEEYRASIKNK